MKRDCKDTTFFVHTQAKQKKHDKILFYFFISNLFRNFAPNLIFGAKIMLFTLEDGRTTRKYTFTTD